MPGGRITFLSKQPGETCFTSQPFDFTSAMSANESISTASVAATVYSGLDPNPSAIISGNAVIQNMTQVKQLIAAGVVGVIYLLTCTANTSFNQVLTQEGLLAVVP